jgi:predicted RNA-binding protein with TRAM domain
MVDIPDSLRSVFSATLREDDGSYVVEVPPGEITHDAVVPGETYRVAVFDSSGTSGTSGTSEKAGHDARGTGHEGHDDDQRIPEPPVEEGEVRDVTIETLGDQGDGIAKVERGYVVIVPDAEPGEQPTVEIEQVRRNVAFASIVDPR